MSLRARIYRQLDPRARRARGLSVANWILVILILVATALAIIETEQTIADVYGHLFLAAELALGLMFSLEYGLRLWTAPERDPAASPWRERLRFILSPAAITDLIAIVASLAVVGGASALLLRLVRVGRILRLAKLGRMSRAFDHMVEAITLRRDELLLSLATARRWRWSPKTGTRRDQLVDDRPPNRPQTATGAASSDVKRMVTSVPSAGADTTSIEALAFCNRDRTISDDSLPGLGHDTPSGRPTPSSATTTRHPDGSERQRREMAPPSRPVNACFSALVSNSLTTRPAGIATSMETGQVSTCKSRRMPSTAWARMTAEAISLR